MANESVHLFDWACPGTLPVLNTEAVEMAVLAGLLLNSRVPPGPLLFDRKHYRYHDLPAGYQITQHRRPLAVGGDFSGVSLRQVHLEQDTAKTTGRGCDLRRAGNALIEIVTEPDLRSASEAVDFAKRLCNVLRDGGVTDGRMECGHVRFDVNVSEDARPKCEVKNINSFAHIASAIGQAAASDCSGKTLGFDQHSGALFVMRDKHEYFFLPEHDIQHAHISSATVSRMASRIGSSRYDEVLGMSDAEASVILNLPSEKYLFWRRIKRETNHRFALTWAVNELQRAVNKHGSRGTDLAQSFRVVMAVYKNIVSRRQGRLLLDDIARGAVVAVPVEAPDLQSAVASVLDAHASTDLNFLAGKVLEKCPGNHATIRHILEQRLLSK